MTFHLFGRHHCKSRIFEGMENFQNDCCRSWTKKPFKNSYSRQLCTYQCYPRGGGPRDRVGTLIRNKNLESNFLTLGIRFQFKVPHLGEGLACLASIPVRF